MPGRTGKGVALSGVIQRAMADVSQWVGDKPIGVTAIYPAHLPSVQGDADALAELVGYVIAHAVQNTNQGEVTIEAELMASDDVPDSVCVLWGEPRKLASEGPWLVLRIASPHGLIAENAMRSIHGQQKTTGAKQKRSVPRIVDCARAIEKQGGQLWVESSPQHGMQLSFSLQLQAARAPTPDMTRLHKAVETQLGGSETGRTLLLVAESADTRQQLVQAFTRAGHRVVVPASGEDLVALARREHPDLILLDLLCVEPAPIDLALILRSDRETRHTPVLFIISSSRPSEEGRHYEAFSLVVRSRQPANLVEAVQEALHSGPESADQVLVIESDHEAGENMVAIAQKGGYRVGRASTPEEAIAMAERYAPNLFLVSARLAEERDYWLLRGLRQLNSEARIFVVADAMTADEGLAAMQRGASGYSDPGRLDDLLSRLGSASEDRA